MVPYVKRRRPKAEHIESKLYVYDQTPVACVASLKALIENVRLILPLIKAPILVIQAERDETVHPSSGTLLYQSVGSKDKTLRLFSNSGHIITLDHDKETVQEEIAQFLHRLVADRNTLK
jgi:carboxylesterase